MSTSTPEEATTSRPVPTAEGQADRVTAVQRRLAAGYYHAVAVRRKVADDVGRVLRGFERL